MKNSYKNIVLFKNHKKTELADRLLSKLYDEAENYDTKVIEVFDCTNKDKKVDAFNFSHQDLLDNGFNFATFIELNTIHSLYIPTEQKSKELWYSAEYSILFTYLQLLKDKIDFDYIWSIEYDVYYSGNWKEFLEIYDKSDADYIGSYIEHAENSNRNKSYWDLILEDIPIKDKATSFGCIFRISRKLLEETVKKILNKEFYSYCEQTFVTIAKMNNMKIEDLCEAPKREIYHMLSLNGLHTPELTEYLIDNNFKNYLFHPVRSSEIVNHYGNKG